MDCFHICYQLLNKATSVHHVDIKQYCGICLSLLFVLFFSFRGPGACQCSCRSAEPSRAVLWGAGAQTPAASLGQGLEALGLMWEPGPLTRTGRSISALKGHDFSCLSRMY